jgi:hypothetical protein
MRCKRFGNRRLLFIHFFIRSLNHTYLFFRCFQRLFGKKNHGRMGNQLLVVGLPPPNLVDRSWKYPLPSDGQRGSWSNQCSTTEYYFKMSFCPISPPPHYHRPHPSIGPVMEGPVPSSPSLPVVRRRNGWLVDTMPVCWRVSMGHVLAALATS